MEEGEESGSRRGGGEEGGKGGGWRELEGGVGRCVFGKEMIVQVI